MWQGSEFSAPALGHSSLETMTHEYYDPSEGIYQHYACAKNGKVLLCNDSDSEYEQVFGNREELQRFIDHLQEVADKAWPDHELCVDIKDLQEAMARIKTLEAKVALIEGRLDPNP